MAEREAPRSPAAPEAAPPPAPDVEHVRRRGAEGADLRGWAARGAALSGARLAGARLAGAELAEADLRGANLRDADLTGADLSRADLRRADMRGAILEGARLDGAHLDRARLDGARLRGAHLAEASLQDASADGADLRGVRAEGGNWDRISLREAILAEAVLVDVHVAEAVLEHASADTSVWTRCALAATDASGVDLRAAVLAECDIAEIDLSRGDLRDTVLDRCDVSAAVLDGAQVGGLRVEGGSLRRASFRRVVGLDDALADLLVEAGAKVPGRRARRVAPSGAARVPRSLPAAALVAVLAAVAWMSVRPLVPGSLIPTITWSGAEDAASAAPTGIEGKVVIPGGGETIMLGEPRNAVVAHSRVARSAHSLVRPRWMLRDPSLDVKDGEPGHDILAVAGSSDRNDIFIRYVFAGEIGAPKDLRFWIEQGPVMSTVEVKLDNARSVVQLTPVDGAEGERVQIPDSYAMYDRVVDVVIPSSRLGSRFDPAGRFWASGFQVCCEDADTRQVALDTLDEAGEVTLVEQQEEPAPEGEGGPAPPPEGDAPPEATEADRRGEADPASPRGPPPPEGAPGPRGPPPPGGPPVPKRPADAGEPGVAPAVEPPPARP